MLQPEPSAADRSPARSRRASPAPSSDAGHNNAAVGGPAFGIDQARLDLRHQAEAVAYGKVVIRQAYGKVPDRSYYGGCSNGGRHALVAAARYGDQYDGFLRVPPATTCRKRRWPASPAQRYRPISSDPTSITGANLATAWTAAERALVSKAVVDKCDALDGVADDIVQDTAACQSRYRWARRSAG